MGRSLCLHKDALDAFDGLKQELKSIREDRSKLKSPQRCGGLPGMRKLVCHKILQHHDKIQYL
jgi:hypothetical protein